MQGPREALLASVRPDDRQAEAVRPEQILGQASEIATLHPVNSLDHILDRLDAAEQELLRSQPGGDAPGVLQAEEHAALPELLGPIQLILRDGIAEPGDLAQNGPERLVNARGFDAGVDDQRAR